jgi:uncharacterized protein YkwD
MPTKNRIRIAAAAATLAVALIGPSNAFGCAYANGNPNDITLKQAKHATLCLLNTQRRAHGLKKLRDNGKLDLASRRHANDMARRNYFAHGDFVGRIRAAHYLRGANRGYTLGENIAWGSDVLATPQQIVKAWMASPGHKANILNGLFQDIGVGIAVGLPAGSSGAGATYATDFGARS